MSGDFGNFSPMIHGLAHSSPTTGGAATGTTVLLAGNDSQADASTTFADQSGRGHTPTVNGNVQYDTADKPVGLTSSVLFDGVGDWLSYADHADFQLGSGDFTIEFFFKGANQICQLAAKRASGGAFEWSILANSGPGTLTFTCGADGTTGSLVNNAVIVAAWTANAWKHVAVTRQGDTWRGFYDGVKGFETVVAGTVADTAAPMTIGGRDGGTNLLTGWMASWKIRTGEALYTASFTPPALPLSA